MFPPRRHWIVIAVTWLVGIGLAYALLVLPEGEHLANEVQRRLGESGVSNPVTAVLLNFRGYDTLLEIGVLFLALLGAWAVGPARPEAHWSAPDAVLLALLRLLVPLMIVIGVSLLWKGATKPGGAFQAGAIIGAAGVLMLIADTRVPWFPAGRSLRILLTFGFVFFLAAATALVFITGGFLQYPPAHAKVLITLIESAATLTIGVTLVALFLGGEPPKPVGAPTPPRKETGVGP